MSSLGELLREYGNFKNRIKLDDLITKYPEGVSISRVLLEKTLNGETFYSYEFLEDPGAVFTAGGAMADIIDNLIDKVGDLNTLNVFLENEGAEKFKFEKTKSKNGRIYVKPIYIGTVKCKV